MNKGRNPTPACRITTNVHVKPASLLVSKDLSHTYVQLIDYVAFPKPVWMCLRKASFILLNKLNNIGFKFRKIWSIYPFWRKVWWVIKNLDVCAFFYDGTEKCCQSAQPKLKVGIRAKKIWVTLLNWVSFVSPYERSASSISRLKNNYQKSYEFQGLWKSRVILTFQGRGTVSSGVAQIIVSCKLAKKYNVWLSGIRA